MNAPNSSPALTFKPSGLVSLLDMLKLYAERFVALSRDLSLWEIAYLKLDHFGLDTIDPSGSSPLEKSRLDEIKKKIEVELEQCELLGLEGTRLALIRIINHLDGGYNPVVANYSSALAYSFGEAHRQLQQDLGRHTFLQVASERVRFYSPSSVLDPETIRAFPKAEVNMKEANRLFALEAHAASVYHSMMALENGLPALAKVWGVSIGERDTWAPITGRIDNAIRDELVPHRPHGYVSPLSSLSAKKRKAVLSGSQKAALEFRYFTNIWRNHIAHGRGSDDENDAKKCLDHVKDFMNILAKDLKLKGT
jgi:hypothetical protein